MPTNILGATIDLERLPENMRAPLQFGMEVAESAAKLISPGEPARNARNVKTYITSGDGALARAYRHSDSSEDDTYFVVLDALAPFQLFSLLHRLHANAYCGHSAAAVWMRIPRDAKDERVELLTDGDYRDPSEALPANWYQRWAWSLGFLALHEIGHIDAGHTDAPNASEILRDLQEPGASRYANPASALRRRRRELEADRIAGRLAMFLISNRGQGHVALEELKELLYGSACIFLFQSLLDRKHVAHRVESEKQSEGETHPSGDARLMYFFGSCRQFPLEGIAQNRIEAVVDDILDRVKTDWKAAQWLVPGRDEDVLREIESLISP